MTEHTAEGLKEAIRVDSEQLRGHVDEIVRSSVEETLNGLLEAEAEQLCGAGRYERSPERMDTRAGHYERKLETKAGVVTLKVPKLRSLPFETAIIDRYRRRESSVEEALVEMYLAGVSVRRVEDITEALWGTRVSSGTVSRLNQKIYLNELVPDRARQMRFAATWLTDSDDVGRIFEEPAGLEPLDLWARGRIEASEPQGLERFICRQCGELLQPLGAALQMSSPPSTRQRSLPPCSACSTEAS